MADGDLKRGRSVAKKNGGAMLRACFLVLALFSQVVAEPPLNTRHEASFVIYPADTNHLGSLFGGKILAEMDRVAGVTTRRLLYASPTGARDAVTVAVKNVEFHKPGRVKDLVFLTGEVVMLREKSITVKVVAERELAGGVREALAEGEFVFVAYDLATGKAIAHGITLPKD